jgi:methyl-accepting chemotaxis protein
MTVTRKIILGFAAMVILLVAVGVAMGYTLISVQNRVKQQRDDAIALQKAMADLKYNAAGQVNALRAELLARSLGGGTLTDITTYQQGSKDALARVKALEEGKDEVATQTASLDKQIAQFNSVSAKVLALARGGEVPQAVDLAEREANPLAILLDRSVGDLQKVTEAAQAADQKSADSAARTAFTFAIVILVIALVIAAVLAIILPRQITRQLRDVITRLSTSTAEMLAVTSQVAAGAVQTATAISEAATTVDEVRQTSLLSSQKATAVSDSAQQADQVAEGGRRAVSETLDGIRRIQEQMSVVADSVVRLSEQTEAVSEIIATSNDIAEQSNLLSVNAAIEAAKASEQGKGFSVVAEEIKNLAAQSKAGVMQVRSILNDIQKATSAAVMAAEQSSKSIEEGASQAVESSQAIESLADNVAAAAQSAMQIVASAQQQLVGMDQISDAMASIDQASAQNAAGARQLESEVQHLQELAVGLRGMIDTSASADSFELAAAAE